MTPMLTIENAHSNELGSLFEALSKAQGKIEHALKDKKNPFFKSSYADLTSVWEACRDPLSQNGLSVMQTVEGTKDDMFLLTWLGHSSGQWIKSKLPLTIIPDAKKDRHGNVIGHQVTPQGIGSAITYARRYALSAMVGICADEDDDGERAMGRKSEKEVLEVKKQFTINPEEEEKKLLSFISEFSQDDPEKIRAFFVKYSTHWKKSISESIIDYQDRSKFEKDFTVFKSRKPK